MATIFNYFLLNNRSKVLYDRPTEKFRPSSLKEQHQVILYVICEVICNIIIIIITSSDDIQPSTLIADQSPSGLLLDIN